MKSTRREFLTHATYANGVKLVMRLAGWDKEGGWLGLGSCPVH
ncbi:MAG: hypothetical protein ACNA77_02660 [Opitutales bacterium]